MASVLLGLGSNVGEPLDNLREAVSRLSDICLISRVSSVYKTEPVGFADQDWFLNCALTAETSLSPLELLDRILRVEIAMGRTRTVRNGPRTIDIDILLFDDLQLEVEDLTVPHPRMYERAFVLHPASEIAPEMSHPTLQTSIKQALENLDGTEQVERISATAWPPQVAP
jgi:2-amino-4-hydroxy-6-hydroxymethyldihydropteridine diphosphokinase